MQPFLQEGKREMTCKDEDLDLTPTHFVSPVFPDLLQRIKTVDVFLYWPFLPVAMITSAVQPERSSCVIVENVHEELWGIGKTRFELFCESFTAHRLIDWLYVRTVPSDKRYNINKSVVNGFVEPQTPDLLLSASILGAHHQWALLLYSLGAKALTVILTCYIPAFAVCSTISCCPST